MRTVRVVNLDNGAEIAARAGVATNVWTRGRGLLGRRSLPEGEGLVIEACRQIHMFFMAFAIDVLHVRRLSPTEGEVTRVLRGIRPNRIGPWVRRSDYVIELPAGTAARTGTEQGHHIALQPAEC
ncbi:MAG TPA: DUF192 domain-containing protein [Chloroflexota bacterium]|nr:DUF192 domain-containing protein [Chloroflexota bacterium]